MRLELYNASQARWFPGLAEYPVDSNEVMTVFNNTRKHLSYNLISPNGDSGVIIHSGTFQKISRLGPMDECIISSGPFSIRLTRNDITDKLVIIEDTEPYEPNSGFVGWVEKHAINRLSKKGIHFYLG